MNVRPLHDRIIIERIEETEQRVGGIIVPDTAKEKPQQAEVVAVGSGRILETGQREPLAVKAGDKVLVGKWSGTDVTIDGTEYLIVKEGDTVLFGKYSGQEIKMDGEEYLIMREEEILGVVTK